MNKKEIIVLVLLILAITTRFVFISFGQSAIPGFAAAGAMMILAGAHLGSWKKWMLPLIVFWISDLIINNIVYAQYFDRFQFFGSLWVYGAYALIIAAAYYLMKKRTVGRLVISSLTAAVIFFLVTNFGSWISPTSPYTKDLSGLMSSYQAGIPFFRNGLMGDVFFSFVLFGLYDFIASRMTSVEPLLFKKSTA